MEFSWPQNLTERNVPPREKQLSKEVQTKINTLRDFLPCGDIISDYNYFLEICGRKFFYKKATQEDTETLINNLKKMLTSWQESQAENNDDTSEEQKIFYQDIPRLEIEAASKLINFYETTS